MFYPKVFILQKECCKKRLQAALQNVDHIYEPYLPCQLLIQALYYWLVVGSKTLECYTSVDEMLWM